MSSEPTIEPQPQGIGGWLGFYVLSSIALAPIAWLLTQFNNVSVSQRSMSGILEVIGVMCGFALLFKRPYALRLVGVDIALRAAFAVFLALKDLNHPSSDLVAPITTLAINLSVSLGWFLYFKTSARVRNTLGRNL